MISSAGFSVKSDKIPYIKLAIRKLDTVKILIMVLWETKSIDNKKYINISEQLVEIGRNLGGWYSQIIKQNSPDTRSGEK